MLTSFSLHVLASGSLPHRAEKTVEIGGYIIPKGATVGAIIRFMHHDPALWGDDVELFNPDRWLKDGKFVDKKQDFLPFSIGRQNNYLPSHTNAWSFKFRQMICR